MTLWTSYHNGALPNAALFHHQDMVSTLSVAFTDQEGMDVFQDKLKNMIFPCASKWATAMCNAYKWWGDATVDITSLGILATFSNNDLLTNKLLEH